MECKEIQDLILTDYQDGRLEKHAYTMLTEHLAICSQCREFADITDKITIMPFKEAKQLEPPPELWNAISSALAAEKQKSDQPGPGILPWLIDRLIMPKPAMAAASILLVILITSIFLSNGAKKNSGPFNPEVQLDYLAHLLEDDNADSDGQPGDFGTPLEEYFL